MATTPERSKRRRYHIAAATSLVLALLAGLVGFAPSAFAHHPIVAGTSSCQDDGKYTVQWTVSNSESAAERYMLIKEFSVTPHGGSPSAPVTNVPVVGNAVDPAGVTTGLTANGSYTGVVSAGNPLGATVVPPSGTVPATTVDIPAGVTSITMSITGYWHYSTGNGTFKEVTQSAEATVDLSKVCNGALKIKKSVVGQTAPVDATYTVTYDNGKGASGQVLIKGGETKTVTGLPYGSYTLAEVGTPPADVATITPNPALVSVDAPLATIWITNTFPDKGGFTVTKHVTGETGGYVPGSTFTVHYVCGTVASGDLVLVDGQTAGVGDLPIGTTCVLSETAKPDTTDASYSYGVESWDPSSSVTIAANNENNVKAVVLSNPIVRISGGFTVTKHVTGETGGYVPGSTFTVHYVCGTVASGDLVLVDGQTAGVGDLPIGTTCVLSETAKPDTTDASYSYGVESWDPSSSVTIAANNENNVKAVVLSNPIVRITGRFIVTKHVTGETGGYVSGSTFTVHFDCGAVASGDFTLGDGETKQASGLPIGTTCTLSETTKPATTDDSYTYGKESWDPSNVVTIAANGNNNAAALVLTNPITRVVGGFTVTKHVTGETGGYVPGSTFSVHYDCGSAASGDLTLTDGQTRAVNNLPVGTDCTLSETAKPATVDPSYRYGIESWDPSNHLTISKGGEVVSATLNNPIERVLGAFSVTKLVTGQSTGYVGGSTFTVSYSCSEGTKGAVTLAKDETKSVGGLPLGTTCTLSETVKAELVDGSYAYTTEIWSPSDMVTISSENQVAAVTLTNPIRRLLGGFSVTKHVTGETGGYVPGTKFTITYDCGDGVVGALQIIDGETQGVGSLPVGTVCHLSETGKPTPKDPSYVFGTETWDPSDTVTITYEDSVVALVLDNPINRVLGSFRLTKKVTGETAGYVPKSTFAVTYDCGGDLTGTLTLTNGETKSVSGLPIGTVCTLREGDKPDTTDPSYVYGQESFDPSDTVTIVANDSDNTVSVVLTNPIDRVLGGFTVTKHVTGATAGYVAGSTFTVTYRCTDGSSGTLTIADGQTAAVKDLAVGTSCTLAEKAKPATTGSVYTWDAESWSPSNTVVITANNADNMVSLTLTNPLKGEVAVLGATQLPRTGSSQTLLLLTIAGLLILAGGCFVVASKRDG